MSNRIQYELINTNNEEGRVHVALAFKGGNCTRNFFTTDAPDQVQEGNFTFYNVFFHYLKLTGQIRHTKLYVQETVSIMSIALTVGHFAQRMEKLLHHIFHLEPDSDVFEQVKKKVMDSFQAIYPKTPTQGKMKAYEFAHYNKGFNFRGLIEDLQYMEFDEFTRLYQKLIVPSNLHAVVLGDVTDITDKELQDTFTVSCPNNHDVEYAMLDSDPYLRKDGHTISEARKNDGYTTLTFDFLTPTDITVRFFILTLIAESLPFEQPLVQVDYADASITFQNRSMRKTKNLVTKVLAEPIYREVSSRILRRFIHWIDKYPREFSIEQASRQIHGINLFDILSFIDLKAYDDYLAQLEDVDFIVREGQVILKKYKGKTMKEFREEYEERTSRREET